MLRRLLVGSGTNREVCRRSTTTVKSGVISGRGKECCLPGSGFLDLRVRCFLRRRGRLRLHSLVAVPLLLLLVGERRLEVERPLLEGWEVDLVLVRGDVEQGVDLLVLPFRPLGGHRCHRRRRCCWRTMIHAFFFFSSC